MVWARQARPNFSLDTDTATMLTRAHQQWSSTASRSIKKRQDTITTTPSARNDTDRSLIFISKAAMQPFWSIVSIAWNLSKNSNITSKNCKPQYPNAGSTSRDVKTISKKWSIDSWWRRNIKGRNIMKLVPNWTRVLTNFSIR